MNTRKQYKLIDKTFGDYVEFKKIHKSIEDCEKVAKQYNLTDYMILEREVSPWKKVNFKFLDQTDEWFTTCEWCGGRLYENYICSECGKETETK